MFQIIARFHSLVSFLRYRKESFLTYINELVSVLEQHNIRLRFIFADNVKMYIRILDDLDVKRLQLALDALIQWSDIWQLPILLINAVYLISVKSPIILMFILMVPPYLLLHTNP